MTRQRINPDPLLRRLIAAAYPGWRGRKVYLEAQAHPLDVRSFWDGGSRDYWTFVNAATAAACGVPPQSAYDRPIAGAAGVNLPPGIICIRHAIFCGKGAGMTVYVRPDELAPLLPRSTDATAVTAAAKGAP